MSAPIINELTRTELGEPRPAFSALDIADSSFGNTKVKGDINLTVTGCDSTSNLPNLLNCEYFRRENSSVLGVHVGLIVGISSKKKMIGPNTPTMVTAMKNLQPFGNVSEVNLPRHAMDKDGHVGMRAACDCAVPVLRSGPYPHPASLIGLLHSSPESILQRGRTRLDEATTAAPTLRIPLERGATQFADWYGSIAHYNLLRTDAIIRGIASQRGGEK